MALRPAPTRGPALATVTELSVRTSEPPRFRLLGRVREVMGSREILANLVRKEVMVKYKSSVLGVVWSMLNPILYLAVFSLVFTVVLDRGIPNFPVYLLSGLLAWNLFSTSLGLAARSVVDNGNLVTKVYFPREILPLASVGAALVDLFFQGLVLAAFMIVSRTGHLGVNLALLPLALVTVLVFTSALAVWVAALNVRYRDTQHLLGLALLTWFWLTPVVYPSALAYEAFADRSLFGISLFHLYLANPMADIVMGFQRALYGVVRPEGIAVLPPVDVGWLALLLVGVLAVALVLLALTWRTFFHLSGDFAEEL